MVNFRPHACGETLVFNKCLKKAKQQKVTVTLGNTQATGKSKVKNQPEQHGYFVILF